jgi:hypothetical protein
MTTAEAKIFKGIFEEIAAQGKVQAEKRPGAAKPASPDEDHADPAASSIVEQARTEFGDTQLQRYPPSLRDAAKVALGLYKVEPTYAEPSPDTMRELAKLDEEKAAQKAQYEALRAAELQRVTDLMKACETDAGLWQVLESEVFSLPAQLGLTKTTKKKSKVEEQYIMDIHGPLYPQYISIALYLLDTAFARSSPYVFKILPRVKELGLPSYVLGVSTPFYSRLASIHWERFGDAHSALDVLQEMQSVGLHADRQVSQLVVRIKDHIHACTFGQQGLFAAAIVEAPPFDTGLEQRLNEMEHLMGGLDASSP